MEWPLQNRKTGKPSTTPTNQAIWKAAMGPAAKEFPQKVQAWLKKVDATSKNWRHGYIPLVQEFVEIQAACSPATIVEMCRAGVEAGQQSFVFRIPEQDQPLSLVQAFEERDDWQPLEPISYVGGGSKSSVRGHSFALASPHGTDQDPLWITQNDAVAQVEAWQTYGCLEPSAFEHAQAVIQAPDASVYCRNKVFVLLGVTSEMGPARHLLKIPGAHVMGIARAGSRLQSLVQWFEQEGSPEATLTVIRHGGANLLEQGPQIARWIVQNIPQQPQPPQQIVLMPLAYMDGEANCRVTVAMDAILTYVMKRVEHVALVYYTSPTTCYTIPKEAVEDAKMRYEEAQSNVLLRLAQWASFGAWLSSSHTFTQQQQQSPVIFNGLVDLQGPNYCLAKTLQQWRCIVARAEGHIVAAPHGPPTRTDSVTHSSDATAALEGLQYFAPNLTFDVQPCSSLLTAIVLHQMQQQQQTSSSDLQEHPLELFWDGSVHGGSWRCPYSSQSCFTLGYIMGKTITTYGWCPTEALAPKPEMPAPEEV